MTADLRVGMRGRVGYGAFEVESPTAAILDQSATAGMGGVS
jgi:hypothetical protein